MNGNVQAADINSQRRLRLRNVPLVNKNASSLMLPVTSLNALIQELMNGYNISKIN